MGRFVNPHGQIGAEPVDANHPRADDRNRFWRRRLHRNNATWMGFLAMTFVVVGMTGLFASFAAPIPLQRAMARDAVLDQALVTDGSKTALEPLREQLDDSAAIVIDGPGPIAARVIAARSAMRTELLHESDVVGARLRLMLIVITIVAAVFGAALLGAGKGRGSP